MDCQESEGNACHGPYGRCTINRGHCFICKFQELWLPPGCDIFDISILDGARRKFHYRGSRCRKMPTMVWRDLSQSFRHWRSSPSARHCAEGREQSSLCSRETPDRRRSHTNKPRSGSKSGRKTCLVRDQEVAHNSGTKSRLGRFSHSLSVGSWASQLTYLPSRPPL